jgi:hypothetical protein
MRRATRLKLKHASGWALLGAWILFGASCGSKPDNGAAMRTALDIVNMICPPEMTVGDCTWRVANFVDPKHADAGTD